MGSRKSKRRPTTRNRASSRDPLQVQISIKFKKPKVPGRNVKTSASLYQEAIRYRVEHGEDHPLFETKIIRWRNGARRGQLSRWRQGNQTDAWGTLGKWLSRATVDVTTVRRR